MIRVLALALALAAGCASGLEIIVEAPASMDPAAKPITRVRLYVADDPMGAMTIAPAMAMPPGFPGTAYAVDPASGLDGGPPPSRFSLEGGTTGKIGQLVAVGFASDGTAVAAISSAAPDIPGDGVESVRLELDAADALPANAPIATEDRIEVWGGSSGFDCVYNSSAPGDNNYDRFVVSSEDWDCDGQKNDDHTLECLPTIYNGTRGPNSLADVDCALMDRTMASVVPECTLAGPPCKDGMGKINGCVQSPYCVPASACAVCTPQGAIEPTLGCLQDMSGLNGTTFAHLVLHYAGIGSANTYAPCPAPIVLPVPSGATGCAASQIVVWDASSNRWDKIMTSQGLMFDFDVDAACHITVMVSGAAATPIGGAPPQIGTMLVVNLAASTTDNHGIALPVVITFEAPTSACTTTSNGFILPLYSSVDGLGDLSLPKSGGCLNELLLPGAGVQPFN